MTRGAKAGIHSLLIMMLPRFRRFLPSMRSICDRFTGHLASVLPPGGRPPTCWPHARSSGLGLSPGCLKAVYPQLQLIKRLGQAIGQVLQVSINLHAAFIAITGGGISFIYRGLYCCLQFHPITEGECSLVLSSLHSRVQLRVGLFPHRVADLQVQQRQQRTLQVKHFVSISYVRHRRSHITMAIDVQLLLRHRDDNVLDLP
mmetsp:Transcript_43994/g.127234  ORF Transcript_43994/g.127234 Transcript_43994/m.127234 type:complete len:202 (+) Transcript_43994:228-833(+)